MVVRVSTLALACALVFAAAAQAGVIDKAQQAETSAAQSWSAWGGDIGFRWNSGLLKNIGVTIESAPAEQTSKHDFRRHEWFAMREASGLQFSVKNGSLLAFTGGSLQMRGGYVLKLADGSKIDLRDLTLRVRANDARVLEVVSSDGKVWFVSDRIMFELADANKTLAVRAADLRIAPALASRLGRPDAAGWEVADLAMNTAVFVQGGLGIDGGTCNPGDNTTFPWPGDTVPNGGGERYTADLFMENFDISPVGCQSCD